MFKFYSKYKVNKLLNLLLFKIIKRKRIIDIYKKYVGEIFLPSGELEVFIESSYDKATGVKKSFIRLVSRGAGHSPYGTLKKYSEAHLFDVKIIENRYWKKHE